MRLPRFLRRKRRCTGVPAQPGAPITGAVAEALEERVLLSFNAFMSALPSGHYATNYILYLYTSGGQAGKWVVNWGDLLNGNPDIVTYLPGGSGTFPTNYNVTHQYASGNAPTAPITATATLSGSSTTATAPFALSQSYGQYKFQNAGRSTFSVGGNTINKAYMAVDSGPTENGDQYVAFAYTPGGGSHTDFAVSQFNNQGDIINSWGDASASPPTGGNGVLYYGSGDTGNDTPEGIAISQYGNYVAVLGKGPSGWLVVVFSTSGNGDGTFGSVLWHASGTFTSGQANGAYFDASDGPTGGLIVAGSDGGNNFAVAHFEATSATVDWTTTVNTGGSLGAAGTSVIEATAYSDETLVVGGYTNYCITGQSGTYTDFTLVELDDSNGQKISTFGNYSCGVSRTNFGKTIHNCSANSSVDTVYSIVPWQDSGGNFNVTAVGSTNEQSSSDNFALAEYRLSTGNIVTSYGSSGNGLVIGPSGDGYSAMLFNNSANSISNDIAVAGTASSDFKVALFTPGGSLDSNFGNSGVFTTDFGDTTSNSTDVAYGIGLNTDGTIIAGGVSAGGLALADYLLNEAVTLS